MKSKVSIKELKTKTKNLVTEWKKKINNQEQQICVLFKSLQIHIFNFFQAFGDFDITRDLLFSLFAMANFKDGNCSAWMKLVTQNIAVGVLIRSVEVTGCGVKGCVGVCGCGFVFVWVWVCVCVGVIDWWVHF